MNEHAEVVLQPEGKRVRIKVGQTVLEAARRAGVDLVSTCGGKGNCGKCRILCETGKDNLGSLTKIEQSLLSPEEISAGYRLACRASVNRDVTVRILEESRTGKQKLQTEGIRTHVKLDPLIRKYHIRLSVPTLEDNRSDADRLLEKLRTEYHLKNLNLGLRVLQQLPSMLRKHDRDVTVVVWNDETIMEVEHGNTAQRVFGYAVDIGTTKLAGYLIDLTTGEVVAADSLMNPQIPYGEDIIARIAFAMQGSRKQKQLQQVLINGLNQILTTLLEKSTVKHREVYEMTVVGNTAMHHLFLNISPKGLALSPYAPATRAGMDVSARAVGVNTNRNANVHVLPVVAGFVGADAVAVALATEIHKRNELCLALDIGTNTEIILGNKDSLMACSCASGPALEGAHIKHGMRAASGAIERAQIDPATFDVRYQTVDNVKPCGICGSGIVDITAEMLKAGLINVMGSMNKQANSPRLRSEDGLEFVVAWGKETSTGQDITLTQRDIREIQSAKAAIHTGALILMRNMRVTEKDIDMVFVAGAFGSYIDPRNARIIGMYPEIALQRVKVVGNAAGTGARMALVSKAARSQAEEISSLIKYVELAAEQDFQADFCNSLCVPYADLSRYPETSEMLKKLGKHPDKPPPMLLTRKKQ
jgi:uncharacterized 2Fe-2S/4Fe-4S cluster protein (DUF4445 family)